MIDSKTDPVVKENHVRPRIKIQFHFILCKLFFGKQEDRGSQREKEHTRQEHKERAVTLHSSSEKTARSLSKLVGRTWKSGVSGGPGRKGEGWRSKRKESTLWDSEA